MTLNLVLRIKLSCTLALIILIAMLFNSAPFFAQVSYGAGATYSLRKTIPTYTGNVMQIRRACDNATTTVGFTSCGELDTVALKKFVVGSNPLSSITTSAAAAFSLRKLRCAYAGNAITVRRSSDNTTSNIGFTANGDLDTTALKTFVGANSGFVTTWFDQSGNGRNATQATAGSQPRIVNAGAIEYQNGMPSIRFLGLTHGLATAAFDVFDASACFNGVAKVNTDLTYNAIVSKTGVPNNHNIPAPLDFYNNQVIVGNGTGATFFTTSQTFNSSQPLGVWTFQSQLAGNKTAFLNGSSILNSATAATHVDVNRPLNIGARNDAVTGLNGWISEVITFATLPSTTDRAFLEWTQGQYYNIGGITLGTIPAGAPSAFVTTWFDQSGNGRDVTQPTAGNQPRIVNSGAVSLQNGRPAISLDGSSTWLIQSAMNVPQPYSLNAIATRTANNGAHQRLVNISATGDSYGYMGVYNGDYATFNGNGVATWNDIAACTPLTAVALNSQAIMTMVSATGATGLIPTVNGTTLNLKNGTSVTGTGFLLGGAWGGSNTSQIWPGTLSEFHIFTSALSTTRKNLLETNQAAHYSKTISNNKYTPPSSTTYNLYVNGIGRETATDSVGGTRSTVGMGISVTTAATAFLKDNGDYLTYGMNCRSTPHTSTSNLPATVLQRWENDWYINKTDVGSNSGTLSIYFDFSDYGVAMSPGVASNYVLMNRSSSSGAFAIVAGTTVTVVGDRVIFTVDAANITSNFYYTIGTRNTSSSPLPIELVSFNCNTIDPKTVELKWTTTSESNSSYFDVERSTDAINYQSIGKVTAAGISVTTLHYSLTDNSALREISYYRLKCVDIDNTYKYSPLCSVTNQTGGDRDLNVYPNPTNGSITVDFDHSAYDQPDSYSIMDITGKKIEVAAIRKANSITIDISALQPGVYLLEVLKGSKKTVKKITLQK
ncbi:MAG: T9SS type A sorting domain-containing protein [Bacteroidota bacterium]